MNINGTTHEYVQKFEIAYRGWSAMVINTISLLGLAGYSVYAYIIIKHRSHFKNPFYIFTLSMMIPDLITIISEMVYAVPAVLLGETELPEVYRIIVGFFADGAWFWSSSHMTLLAADRVVAVCFYSRYFDLFTPRKLRMLILSSIIYGFTVISIMYGCTCQYHFKHYAWLFECQENSCASVALMINQTVSNGSVVVVVISMAVVIVVVHRSARKIRSSKTSLDRQQKREIKLVVQFLIIGLVFTLDQIFFWTFPRLVAANLVSVYIAGNLINIFYLFCSCLHPFLYIGFSSEVKNKFFVNKKQNEPMKHAQHGGIIHVNKQIPEHNDDVLIDGLK